MTKHAHEHESHKAHGTGHAVDEGPPAAMPEPKPEKLTVVDIKPDLAAIRKRLAERRNQVFGGTPGPFNTTDLADAEWLLVELDKAMGIEGMSPADLAELEKLEKLRALTEPSDIAVNARLLSKHGKLTPEELVMRDYLAQKQDAKLDVAQALRFKELSEKKAKLAK